MNVHHLELFFYVAKYEGITAAVRKMPYGIQQPAVSGQLLQLEKNLEVKLFHRRPFALTPAGEELYDFIYPFFSKLPEIAEQLTGDDQRRLRLAASSLVLTNHLPLLLDELKRSVPDLRLTLRDFLPGSVEEALVNEEIDVAISAVPAKAEPGIQVEPLLDLPLALLVPKADQVPLAKLLEQADENGRIALPLVALPDYETITQLFQDGLSDRGYKWQPTIEVNSLDLIQTYAERGYGFGLTVQAPGVPIAETMAQIPLPDFPVMKLGVLHRGNLKPLAAQFVENVHRYAGQVS